MKVYKKGIIRIDTELHIVAKNSIGSMHLAGCNLMPGILKIDTISLNENQFCIGGHWFDMNNFLFEKPIERVLNETKVS